MAEARSSPPFLSLPARLAIWAERQPDSVAVVVPDGRAPNGGAAWRQISFGEAAQRMRGYAAGLRAMGITRGERVVLMIRPGLDFLPLTYALFQIGAVPVLIDPGMGRGKLLDCVRQVRPEGFVGIPLAHVARLLFPGAFRGVRHLVTLGPKLGWGGCTAASLLRHGEDREPAVLAPQDLAAIIFTTGSTGPPKGVEYTHGMFATQVWAR